LNGAVSAGGIVTHRPTGRCDVRLMGVVGRIRPVLDPSQKSVFLTRGIHRRAAIEDWRV